MDQRHRLTPEIRAGEELAIGDGAQMLALAGGEIIGAVEPRVTEDALVDPVCQHWIHQRPIEARRRNTPAQPVPQHRGLDMIKRASRAPRGVVCDLREHRPPSDMTEIVDRDQRRRQIVKDRVPALAGEDRRGIEGPGDAERCAFQRWVEPVKHRLDRLLARQDIGKDQVRRPDLHLDQSDAPTIRHRPGLTTLVAAGVPDSEIDAAEVRALSGCGQRREHDRGV